MEYTDPFEPIAEPATAPSRPPTIAPSWPLMLWPTAAPMPAPSSPPMTGSADADVEMVTLAAVAAAMAAISKGFLNISISCRF